MKDNELIQYRKEHFAVEIKEVHGSLMYKDEKVLSVTHNGNQWTSIALNRAEASQVITALSIWLEG